MSLDDLRPILSGLAGSVVAVWLSHKLARWIPSSLNGKSAELLVRQNRAAIWCANTLSAMGLVGAVALYQWAGFSNNDWRPLGLGFGFAFTAPLLIVPAVSWLRGMKRKRGPCELRPLATHASNGDVWAVAPRYSAVFHQRHAHPLTRSTGKDSVQSPLSRLVQELG